MGFFRVYAGPDGESHIEEMDTSQEEYASHQNIAEVKIQHFPEMRDMPFHPLPDRRLIIHLSGEAEIGLSDGTKQIFRPGDVRLMEDTTGKGHTHRDLSLNSAVYVYLND